MTSNINPVNIDPTYPVAGTDNDSQGFRNIFAEIRRNFEHARQEINGLQSNGIFKSALAGTTLDNSGNGVLLNEFQFRDISEVVVTKGSASGNVTFDYSESSYQTVSTAGSIVVGFSNFPPNNQLGKIRIEFSITDVAHTVTLPSAVSVGAVDLQGIVPSTNVITFDAVGTYILEFSTHNSGTTIAVEDFTRTRTKNDVRTVTATGQQGDVPGMLVSDATNLYVCISAYDGTTAIWRKLTLETI